MGGPHSEEITEDTLIVGDARAKKSDQEYLLKLENSLNAGGPAIHPGNSQYMGHIMKMDLHGAARRAPDALIEKLKALDGELKLGARLRGSRSPTDFLQETISSQPNTSDAMLWLSPIMSSEHGAIALLPIPCLCDLLTGDREGDMGGEKGAQKARVLERLEAYVKGEAISDSREVLGRILSRLADPSPIQRDSAREVAKELLGASVLVGNQSSSMSWLDGLLALKSYQDGAWLLPLLTSAIEVELEPGAVLAMLSFLRRVSLQAAAMSAAKLLTGRRLLSHGLMRLPDGASTLVGLLKDASTTQGSPWQDHAGSDKMEMCSLGSIEVPASIKNAMEVALALAPEDTAQPLFDFLLEHGGKSIFEGQGALALLKAGVELAGLSERLLDGLSTESSLELLKTCGLKRETAMRILPKIEQGPVSGLSPQEASALRATVESLEGPDMARVLGLLPAKEADSAMDVDGSNGGSGGNSMPTLRRRVTRDMSKVVKGALERRAEKEEKDKETKEALKLSRAHAMVAKAATALEPGGLSTRVGDRSRWDLSTLLHHSRWSELLSRGEAILQGSLEMEPTLALDSLEAILWHPRTTGAVWLDEHARRGGPSILQEGFRKEGAAVHVASLILNEKTLKVSPRRLGLLRALIGPDGRVSGGSLVAVVSSLEDGGSKARGLAHMIYLAFPKAWEAAGLRPIEAECQGSGALDAYPSSLSKETHGLLLRLPIQEEGGPAAYHRIRRLARYHPGILLDRLGLLGALLRSRPGLSSEDFLVEGHMSLFVRVLGCLEALKDTGRLFQHTDFPPVVKLLIAPLDHAAQTAEKTTVSALSPLVSQTAALLLRGLVFIEQAPRGELYIGLEGAIEEESVKLKRLQETWPEIGTLEDAVGIIHSSLPGCREAPSEGFKSWPPSEEEVTLFKILYYKPRILKTAKPERP